MTETKFLRKYSKGFFLAINACLFFGLPVVASADVIISEVMYDPPGSDTQQEYIEVRNTGATAVDIRKWKINDGANHVLNVPPKNGGVGSTLIAPGAFAVIASDATAFRAKYPQVTVVIDAAISLKNSERTISLRDASSTVMSSFSYTNTEAAGDGNSLQVVAGVIVSGPPTPGQENAPGAPAVATVVQNKTASPETRPIVHAEPVVKNTKRTKTSAKTKEPLVGAFVAPDASADTEPTPVVPLGDANPQALWWYGGAGLLTLAAAGASVFIRKKQNTEWDIEEMSDDV